MQITVNGEPRDVPDGSTLDELLGVLGLADVRVAVERNGQIVPLSEYGACRLQQGDQFEIVTLVGGG